MDKVYCKNCRFINEIHHEKKPTVFECLSPKNKKRKDTPLGPVVTLERMPAKINAKNDCKWFSASRPKPSKEDRGPTVGMKTILDHERRIKDLEAFMSIMAEHIKTEQEKPKNKEAKDGEVCEISKSGATDPSRPREPDSGVGEKGKKEKG